MKKSKLIKKLKAEKAKTKIRKDVLINFRERALKAERQIPFLENSVANISSINVTLRNDLDTTKDAVNHMTKQNKRINKLVPLAANFDRVNKELVALDEKSIKDGGEHYRTKGELNKKMAENASLDLENLKGVRKELMVAIETLAKVLHPNLDLNPRQIYSSEFNTYVDSPYNRPLSELSDHERILVTLYGIITK